MSALLDNPVTPSTASSSPTAALAAKVTAACPFPAVGAASASSAASTASAAAAAAASSSSSAASVPLCLVPGKQSAACNYWLYPIVVANADAVITNLNALGVDAYRGNQLCYGCAVLCCDVQRSYSDGLYQVPLSWRWCLRRRSGSRLWPLPPLIARRRLRRRLLPPIPPLTLLLRLLRLLLPPPPPPPQPQRRTCRACCGLPPLNT